MARIAMLTHEYAPYPGGVARYCEELARAAVALGHEVTVLAPDFGAKPSDDDVSQTTGIRIVRFPGGVYRNHPANIARLAVRIARLLAIGRYDIVHAADWPMIIALGLVPGDTRKRIATIHGTDAATLFGDRRARYSGSRMAVRRLARYVPNSAFTAGYLRRFFPAIAQERIRVAPLGVAADWFDPVPAEQLAEFAHRIAQRRGRIVLGTVARVEARKGHLAAVEALALLPDDLRRDITYVSVGKVIDRPLFDRIGAAARDGDVEFLSLGPVENWAVKAAYATFDCFVLTAQENPVNVEGFGLVLLEAAAQGTPAMVTPVHAIPEVVDAGVTGWIAEGADPAAIAAMMRRVLTDPAALSAMPAACIARAASFSWERCARETYAPLT